MQTTFQFTAGVLGIEAPLGKMRIRWRPEPLAEELTPGSKRWKPFSPEFRILAPDSLQSHPLAPDIVGTSDSTNMQSKSAAFAAFHNEIPPAIIQTVRRFQSHQCLLMLLLHRQPDVLDLAHTNPVLAYCLANNDQFRNTGDSVALQLALGHSRQKQRALLEWLGFPGSEAMARTLRRIPPESASPSLLRRLSYAMEGDPNLVAQLAHIPTVNAGVLELLVDRQIRPLVTTKLLLTVADQADELCIGHTADQLGGALALLCEMGATIPVRPLTSIQQIARLQEQTDIAYQVYLRRQATERETLQRKRVRRHNAVRARRSTHKGKACPYPPPPIPGTPAIVPITSATDLAHEGQIQGNCVASYLQRVLGGSCYLYRVTSPERATLSIAPTPGGEWRRVEIKGPKNQKVELTTIRAVECWLRQHRLSVGNAN